MRSFHTNDVSWHFAAPDPAVDAASQLAADLWILADQAAISPLLRSMFSSLRRIDVPDPERHMKTILDCLHERACRSREEADSHGPDPDVASLLREIADGFAAHADPEQSVAFLGHLIGTVEGLTAQIGHNPDLLAALLCIGVSVDAPLRECLDGFFEVHDSALRRLFGFHELGATYRPDIARFFDAVLARSRAHVAAEDAGHAEARELLTEARVKYQAIGLRVEAASCDRLAALAARADGDPASAMELITNAKGTLGEYGAMREVGLCHLQAGMVHLDMTEPIRALAEAERAVHVFSEMSAWDEAEVGADLCSRAAELAGDLERALSMSRLAYAFCEARADAGPSGDSLINRPR